MKNLLTVASLGCCAVAASACGTAAPEEDSAAENVLALVRTADGAEVHFLEPTRGELTLESTPAVGGEEPLEALAAGEAERVAEDRGMLVAAPLNATSFHRLYCTSGWTCLLNKTGPLERTMAAKGYEVKVYSERGMVRLSVRRKWLSGWKQVEDSDVLPGREKPSTFGDRWNTAFRYPIKIEVKNAEGDLYHIAIRWISPRP